MIHKLETLRSWAIAFTLGAAIGGYGLGNLPQITISPAHGLKDDIQARMVDGGWCAQTDPRGVVYLFACRDAYIAAELNNREVEADQTEAIKASMRQTLDSNAKRRVKP